MLREENQERTRFSYRKQRLFLEDPTAWRENGKRLTENKTHTYTWNRRSTEISLRPETVSSHPFISKRIVSFHEQYWHRNGLLWYYRRAASTWKGKWLSKNCDSYITHRSHYPSGSPTTCFSDKRINIIPSRMYILVSKVTARWWGHRRFFFSLLLL